jgi:putative FmdB family regulatory protein
VEMPTYEYYCTSCGFEFEEFQSIASEPINICPKCEGQVKRRISGGTGLIFKGSGFYITDYKNKKSSPAKTSEEPKKKEKKETKVS